MAWSEKPVMIVLCCNTGDCDAEIEVEQYESWRGKCPECGTLLEYEHDCALWWGADDDAVCLDYLRKVDPES